MTIYLRKSPLWPVLKWGVGLAVGLYVVWVLVVEFLG